MLPSACADPGDRVLTPISLNSKTNYFSGTHFFYKHIQIGTEARLCLDKFQIEAQIMLIVCLNEVMPRKPLLKSPAFFGYPTPFQTPEVKFGNEHGFTENFYINDQFLPEICEIVRQKTDFTDDFGKSLLAFM